MSALGRLKELLAAAKTMSETGISWGEARRQLADLAIPIAEELVASQEALSPKQRENGDLVFQVRVSNHGARPYPPREVALRLVSDWEQKAWDEGQPLVRVRLEEPTALRLDSLAKALENQRR